MTTGIILLSGGKGTRMKLSTPKQYLPLLEKTVVEHSFDLFLSIEEISEIVVVCSPEWHPIFSRPHARIPISFASPGKRRQDSLWNGLQKLSPHTNHVCIHDAARPCITENLVKHVIKAARQHGAATLGVPIKYTVKEGSQDGFINKTLNRENLWEAQTPQSATLKSLHTGFSLVQEKNLSITDDVSIIELLKLPIKLVLGCHKNIKITTKSDLAIAENFLINQKPLLSR